MACTDACALSSARTQRSRARGQCLPWFRFTFVKADCQQESLPGLFYASLYAPTPTNINIYYMSHYQTGTKKSNTFFSNHFNPKQCGTFLLVVNNSWQNAVSDCRSVVEQALQKVHCGASRNTWTATERQASRLISIPAQWSRRPVAPCPW